MYMYIYVSTYIYIFIYMHVCVCICIFLHIRSNVSFDVPAIQQNHLTLFLRERRALLLIYRYYCQSRGLFCRYVGHF